MRKIYMVMAFLLGSLLAIGWMAPAHADRFHHPRHSNQGYYNHGYHGGYHHGYRSFNRGLLIGAVVGGLIYESNHSRVIVRDSYPYYYSPNYVYPSWQIIYVREFDPQCGCDITVKRYMDRWGNIR